MSHSPVKVGLVSLGCAKNLIDSEIMSGHIAKAGMSMIGDARDADVIIVNTCSFIDASKKESLQAIFDMQDERSASNKPKQKLIVAGCMSQRYQGELPKLLPEVDAFIGLDQITKVVPVIQEVLGHKSVDNEQLDFTTEKPTYIPDFDTPRIRLTPKHTAYIKIAEGCNHPCTFCIIPQIRGRHRSRTVESVVKEARRLVAEGVKEINLISQDTTYFGMDRWENDRPSPRSGVDSTKGESIATLLRALNEIEGDFWIRLLYTHPAHWSDELIKTIAECPKVARYVDIPLQHINTAMLKRMQRETTGDYIRDLIARMRAGIPDLAIRTTFIVGFPGETEEEFIELVDFLKDTKFDRVGIFKYSREEGTKAAKMEEQIHHKTKERRWSVAMDTLRSLSEKRTAGLIGKKIRVLVDKPGEARSEGDAMEIDGTVFVKETLPVGQFATVTISGNRDYDLIAQ